MRLRPDNIERNLMLLHGLNMAENVMVELAKKEWAGNRPMRSCARAA